MSGKEKTPATAAFSAPHVLFEAGKTGRKPGVANCRKWKHGVSAQKTLPQTPDEQNSDQV